MSLPQPTNPCRICGSVIADEWLHPREMMFGLRETFEYFRCAACGCLQIDQAPAAMDKYYPNNYYSYGNPAAKSPAKPESWASKIKRQWVWIPMARHRMGLGSLWGQALCAVKSGPYVPEWLGFLDGPVSLHGGVLDVGCGSGMGLLALRDCGFTNLLGVDPFIPKAVAYSGGVRVLKCQLSEVVGKFGVITFHHVFEHLDDPLATLRQARQLLAPGGRILIRIPLFDSLAAQKYRENWVSLDAPRHITLQTRRSMELVAQKTEMKIVRVVYDSTEFQFLGSEQYLADIPLTDSRSHYAQAGQSMFPIETIKQFTAQAAQLNATQQGDQAAFVLAAA